MSKALGLLSGGLDSSLAALTLQRQGIEVTCISFSTPFFGPAKARKAVAQLGIPLIVQEIGEVHLEMVKSPRYGYGRNMNPCIDCHALMFRLAGRVMEEQGFDFLFSGEVLGQRPMSQNLSALQAVARHSGYSDRILRPLSARLLPITPMEERGLVDRAQLLDIQGRSRRRQEELAKAWGLTDYPSSGGGCLLTEERFSDRLRDLFAHTPGATVADVELLKVGRHFRLSPAAKLILGRNQQENTLLEGLARSADVLLKTVGFTGPLGLLCGAPTEVDLETAAAVVSAYGKGQEAGMVEVRLLQAGHERVIRIVPCDRSLCQGWLI